MFDSVLDSIQIGECCFVEKGTTLTRKEAVLGNVPVIAGGMAPSCYHNKSNRSKDVITISASGANAGFVAYWDIPIFATDCNTVISKDKNKFPIEFIYVALILQQKNIYELQRGAGQPHVYGKDIEKLSIPNPPTSDQINFSSYVKSIDKLKFEVCKKISIVKV